MGIVARVSERACATTGIHRDATGGRERLDISTAERCSFTVQERERERERGKEREGTSYLSVAFEATGERAERSLTPQRAFFCIVDGIIGVCSSVCSLSALSRSLPLPTVIAIVTAVLLSAEYKLQAYCALLKSNKTRKGPQGCHCWVCRYNVLWCCGSGNGAAAAARPRRGSLLLFRETNSFTFFDHVKR